uniref:Lariat debranching enzyme C-terminal domain-containing protein n=1 Tax=Pristionchus pacificus TaxID=54126 RepID=A0A8R1V5A3_PRIPA
MCGESEDEFVKEEEVKREDVNEDEIKIEIKEKEGKRKIRVAVAGCVHGEIDKVYRTMEQLEKDGNGKFDLLLCCGDFQATRNYGDLHHMHVPDKYKSLETFYQYYSQAKKAPVLTVFIGGNHEASAFMCELPNGGWVAPNIYYMGNSNVLKYGGLRIGGLSGIYKGKDYHKGRFECPPFPSGSNISAYHVRSLDVFRCKQMSSMDIFLSHDWPTGIWDYGDKDWLLRKKVHFTEEVNAGTMGNPGARELLMKLRPQYWFSAHMHIGFPALVDHPKKEGEENEKVTRFLSLDKPLPRRHFLQSIDLWVDENADLSLSYDEEWLAILKNTDSLVCTTDKKAYLPSKMNKTERYDFTPTEEELAEIRSLKDDFHIPFNFQPTAPPLMKDDEEDKRAPPAFYYRNPQSTQFCSWLGIQDLNDIWANTSSTVATPHYELEISREGMNDVEQDREKFGEEDFIIDTGTEGEEEEGEEGMGVGDGNGLGDWIPPSIDSNEEKDEGEKTIEFKRRKVDFDPEE